LTVATALFFDAAQRRRELPGLAPHLRERAQALVPDEFHDVAAQPIFDALVIGEGFARARHEGFIGVPILDEGERHDLVGEYESRDGRDVLPRGSWWELWSTADDQYALMPGDDEPALTLAVCALIRTGSLVKLRRFVSGVELAPGGVQVRTPPAIATEVCVREPGTPSPHRRTARRTGRS
jgi:hypothetical protein